nr:MAG TPA: hypothetical protein [Caudoviricetes sp.]
MTPFNSILCKSKVSPSLFLMVALNIFETTDFKCGH